MNKKEMKSLANKMASAIETGLNLPNVVEDKKAFLKLPDTSKRISKSNPVHACAVGIAIFGLDGKTSKQRIKAYIKGLCDDFIGHKEYAAKILGIPTKAACLISNAHYEGVTAKTIAETLRKTPELYFD